MRISDWSSDVCSSDLTLGIAIGNPARADLGGLFGDRRMLTGPPIEMESADPEHGLDLGERVGEAFQRCGQPHHVGDAREVSRILHDAALLRERRSEEHTSELPSLMRSSYAVFCLTKKQQKETTYVS